jgi:hypothetical protein
MDGWSDCKTACRQMVSMSNELKERNILKLVLIVRFACATLDVGHPILWGFQWIGISPSKSSSFAETWQHHTVNIDFVQNYLNSRIDTNLSFLHIHELHFPFFEIQWPMDCSVNNESQSNNLVNQRFDITKLLMYPNNNQPLHQWRLNLPYFRHWLNRDEGWSRLAFASVG